MCCCYGRPADMPNYNELLKHIHGNHSSLFYGR
jgi:hypothetical protein